MTTEANTTELARWTSAKYNLTVAQRAWAAVEPEEDCSVRQHVALALEDACNGVFTTAAPDIEAVIDKLMLWWGETLFDDSYGSSLNRNVIGDLRRIQMLEAGVSETEAYGRSPVQVAELTAAWHSALAAYHERERLFVEGPSPRWEGRDTASIVEAMDSAAGELLVLPAPNLGGVIQKLEILWEDNHFESEEDGLMCFHALRDLNRLVRA